MQIFLLGVSPQAGDGGFLREDTHKPTAPKLYIFF